MVEDVVSHHADREIGPLFETEVPEETHVHIEVAGAMVLVTGLVGPSGQEVVGGNRG